MYTPYLSSDHYIWLLWNIDVHIGYAIHLVFRSSRMCSCSTYFVLLLISALLLVCLALLIVSAWMTCRSKDPLAFVPPWLLTPNWWTRFVDVLQYPSLNSDTIWLIWLGTKYLQSAVSNASLNTHFSKLTPSICVDNCGICINKGTKISSTIDMWYTMIIM